MSFTWMASWKILWSFVFFMSIHLDFAYAESKEQVIANMKKETDECYKKAICSSKNKTVRSKNLKKCYRSGFKKCRAEFYSRKRKDRRAYSSCRKVVADRANKASWEQCSSWFK